MKVGVTKLNETNAMVEGLKGDLTKLEPVLEQASKDAEKLLKQVEIDKADAAKVKEKVNRSRSGVREEPNTTAFGRRRRLQE